MWDDRASAMMGMWVSRVRQATPMDTKDLLGGVPACHARRVV